MPAVLMLSLAVSACGGSPASSSAPGSAKPAASSPPVSASSPGPSAAGSSSAAPAAAASAKQETWEMGSIIDLTGPGAIGGAAQKPGIEFLVEQINKSGGVNGHKLSVKFCDTQSTPTGGATCASQLSSVNSHVVLLQAILPSTQGALPQLSKDVVAFSVLPVLFPKAGTQVFQVSPMEATVVAPMIKAVKDAQLTTIGVLYTSDASGTAQLKAVQEAAGPAGLKVVTQPMSPTATDVTSQLLQLKQAGAQVLFFSSIGVATTRSLTSYHTLGFTMPVVVGAAVVVNSFLKSLSFPIPPKLYGISTLVVGTEGLTPREVDAWAKFRKDFQDYGHQPVDTQISSGYYVGCVAAAALKGTNGGSASAMADYAAKNSINCLGAEMRFNVPGLNVVTNQPTSISQAGVKPADGWGPLRGKL
ncbi:MAG: ABC transporter substrate-binding protein [Chloroflexota bacterium]|nr:ABC transporter substrate-binding protein [Chloroflexota bacterium]